MLKPILALFLAAAPIVFARPAAQEEDLPTVKMTRARALKGLRSCAKNRLGAGCSDYSADFLINRYFRGRDDLEVLKVLLDTWPYGDGALSEGLGTFYGDMLEKRPLVFLRAVAVRPAKERHDLCEAAGRGDGGGMSEKELSAVKTNLGRVARGRDARLAKAARACWATVSEANSEAWSQRH
jgi:hypothetical protein